MIGDIDVATYDYGRCVPQELTNPMLPSCVVLTDTEFTRQQTEAFKGP